MRHPNKTKLSQQRVSATVSTYVSTSVLTSVSIKALLILIATTLTMPLQAAESAAVIKPLEPGSVSEADGLAAWGRVFEVASHPRCANCHVGADNTPMWSGPSYGKTRPHGMNINAGASRIGAETLVCSTCHTTTVSDAGNAEPHTAPRVAMAWRLAPLEAEWFGKSSAYICNQLRDSQRNGGRSITEVAEHLGHDVILHWAWTPGGNREPAPYSLQEHVDDILAWGAAGTPCPATE